MNKKTLKDKVSKIMQPYLTREEAEDVIPRIVSNIKDSFKEGRDTLSTEPYSLVSGSFLWRRTPEGEDYWYGLSVKIADRLAAKEYGSTSNTPS